MKYQLIKPINQNYSIIQQILTNRGIPFNEIEHYLNTTDADINPPQALGQDKLKEATKNLIWTIQHWKEAIIIVDSDADGMTSSALLLNYLHDIFPSWVENKITYLFHNGKQHGLDDLIDQDCFHKRNLYLVIIPDAGSNNADGCTRLKKNGITTIILDHHLCDIENPDAIIINNQLSDFPNKNFSGVGIVWEFCRYLDKILQINNADNYLDLVALGNCADMMSMTSIETKHLINKGFQNVKNPFFFNLAQKNSYSMNNKINHTSVAFYVAPYLNAICRSGTQQQKELVFKSMLKYEAFKDVVSTKRGHLLGETESIVEQAMRVVTNVKNRQTKVQDAGLELLEKKIQSENLLEHKVLLFLLEPGQIDKNVAGLVANKVMAKYQRPVCVLTRVIQQDGLPWQPYKDPVVSYQGSARGCDKVGIKDFKNICAETGCVMYCAGHPNAFGLGILKENVQDFISKTDSALADMKEQAVYYVDYIYQGDNVDPLALLSIADMDSLWGQNIEEPFLCIEHLKVTANMVTVYQKKDNTLKISLPNGISLIKFKASDQECEKLKNTNGYYEMNIIGRANKNQWMGNIFAQMYIEQYEIVDSNKYIF